MDGIVDSVQIQRLSLLGQVHLTGAGTALGLGTHHQVLLGAVGHDLAQQLCKAGCVVSLFVSIALVGLGDLGVALTLCHASHSQIHTDLTALALEVCAQTINDLLRHALCLADANNMLGDVGVAGLFHKSGSGSLANGALSGDLTLSDITTNGANVFLHKNLPPFDLLKMIQDGNHPPVASMLSSRAAGYRKSHGRGLCVLPFPWLYYSE